MAYSKCGGGPSTIGEALRLMIRLLHSRALHDLKDYLPGLNFCIVQAWKYQPWVQEAVNKRLNKLADVVPPTIGFHVRGGDKLAEDKMLVSKVL